MRKPSPRLRKTKWLRVGKSIRLRSLRLDPQRITTNSDFLVGLDDGALLAGEFAAGNQSGVSSFRGQPVTALIVQHQRDVHPANLRIALQGQVHRNRS